MSELDSAKKKCPFSNIFFVLPSADSFPFYFLFRLILLLLLLFLLFLLPPASTALARSTQVRTRNTRSAKQRCAHLDSNVSVLHKNEGGIGKSQVLEGGDGFPNASPVLVDHEILPCGQLPREGLTVLKPIRCVLCSPSWESGGSTCQQN